MLLDRIIRAWKDPEYRLNLSVEEQALLPENPAGAIELTDDELDMAVAKSTNRRNIIKLSAHHRTILGRDIKAMPSNQLLPLSQAQHVTSLGCGCMLKPELVDDTDGARHELFIGRQFASGIVVVIFQPNANVTAQQYGLSGCRQLSRVDCRDAEY